MEGLEPPAPTPPALCSTRLSYTENTSPSQQLVGMVRFELTASGSRSQRSTRLSYTPNIPPCLALSLCSCLALAGRAVGQESTGEDACNTRRQNSSAHIPYLAQSRTEIKTFG